MRQSTVKWSRHHTERMLDQERMTAQYNKMATRAAATFQPGTEVLVHNVRSKTTRAVVVGTRDEPCSYIVEFPNGA
jgi:hypothetical protein